MRRQIVLLTVLLTGAIASGWFALSKQAPSKPARRPLVDPVRANAVFHKEVLPVLQQYCWDCHGDGMDKGDVSLDAFTNVTAVLKDRRIWERVMHTVESGEMPPKKKKQPTAAERELVGKWIDQTLFPIDPDNPDPGRVTIRRLNRTEYNNTIRDLVGVEFRPADDFPQDDLGYGFDNIGDALSLPPILLEKYLAAAEQVLDAAIVVGKPETPVWRFEAADLQGGQDNGPVRGLPSNGEIFAWIKFPLPGKYLMRVRAHGEQAGDDRVRMVLRHEDRDLQQFEVKQGKNRPGDFELEFEVAQAGEQRVAVAFLNDYYEEKWVEIPREGRRPRREMRIADRNFFCHFLEVTGPLGVEIPLPETHRRIFTRLPASAGEEAAVAREVIGSFAQRAWRRPVAPAELDRLMNLHASLREGEESFEAAVKQTLTAVLVSPHFLFRGELQPDPNNPAQVQDIDEYALASRLSYFLWSSMPDEELFALAARKQLRKQLAAQLDRMLKSPKAEALTANFAGQWLQLRQLEVLEPDRKKFPAFDEQLRADMRRETERLFGHIVHEDRPVSDFLLADYTFLNERLARHYGLPGVSGDEFVRVSLAGTPRQGVLTHGSILTLTSNPTRTSPVKRGKWVLENILSTPPPPPPPGVPELEAGEKLTGTLRQRMEKHSENAGCASCHQRMDPIGFAFEHFDGVGAYRDRDGGDPVEPAGQLPGGEAFQDHRGLNEILASAKRADFLRCLAEKLLTYALGRGLEYYDRPAVARIVQSLEQNELRFSALVRGVVDSVPFQKRRGEGDLTVTAMAK